MLRLTQHLLQPNCSCCVSNCSCCVPNCSCCIPNCTCVSSCSCCVPNCSCINEYDVFNLVVVDTGLVSVSLLNAFFLACSTLSVFLASNTLSVFLRKYTSKYSAYAEMVGIMATVLRGDGISPRHFCRHVPWTNDKLVENLKGQPDGWDNQTV